MDREVVFLAGELRDCAAARDDREGRDTRHGKRFDVIAAEEEDDVGIGFVENLSQLAHAGACLIELFRFLVRRAREHVRRMTRADGRYDFTHRTSPRASNQPRPQPQQPTPSNQPLASSPLFVDFVYVPNAKLGQPRAKSIKV